KVGAEFGDDADPVEVATEDDAALLQAEGGEKSGARLQRIGAAVDDQPLFQIGEGASAGAVDRRKRTPRRHGRGEGAYVEVALDLVARHQVEPAPKSDGKAEAAPNRLRDEGERELPLVGEARRQVDAVADHRRLGEPERGDRGDSRLRLGPAEDEAVGELVVELQALQP